MPGEGAGVLARRGLQGLVGEHIEASEVGTPQGGPLSPLLANILLDQLDRELHRRGHRFARYADDLIILVKSERAAQRVMRSITRYLETSLKLTVNQIRHLLDLGVSLKTAIQHGVSSKSYWHMARTPAVQQALSNAWLKAQGLVSIKDLWCKAQGYQT